jgi:hypothetical protein
MVAHLAAKRNFSYVELQTLSFSNNSTASLEYLTADPNRVKLGGFPF